MNISGKTEKKVSKVSTGNCRCDLGYIIKDHIHVLMQLLTNDLPQFNFRMQTTKCLNTAVMLIQFLLGNKGIQIADSCDTRAVIARHTEGTDNNDAILVDLRKQLFSKKEKARTLYYVLMSDGYFPSQTGTENKYFPGHVFILEKVWNAATRKHEYYFYQSYINKYTLREHIVMNKGLLVSTERTTELMNHLERVMKSETWSSDNVKRWYDMTFADSSNLLDSSSKQRFYLCFRKAKTSICLEKLEKYLQKLSKKLDKLPIALLDDVYGNSNLYEDPTKALTNKHMKSQIATLLNKIQVSKQSSKNETT